MECVILMGIQGSGKSTFFKERFADSHVRVNPDMLKTRHRELLLVRACIEGKTKFVVDNTNVKRDDRTRYISIAKDAGFRVVGYYLQSQLDACIERNDARAAPIPVGAIRGTHKRLELPTLDEGFDELFYVQQIDGAFAVKDWSDEV
ncbi:AAA family ATPase [Myxococcota bacterium]